MAMSSRVENGVGMITTLVGISELVAQMLTPANAFFKAFPLLSIPIILLGCALSGHAVYRQSRLRQPH